MLCDLLGRTGRAGRPDSLFRRPGISQYADEWGVVSTADAWDDSYVEAARLHGWAGTGCFAMRIMWSDMVPFLGRLAELYPDSRNDRHRLFTAFGIEEYVHLSRQDKVAQAVSLVLARQTGLWHRNADGSERERDTPHRVPVFDFAAIAAELRMLEAEVAGWEDWFHSARISPVFITYEELARDPGSQLVRVMSALGKGDAAPPLPATAKLADQINEEWAARFRSEAGVGS
jgi:trehalose 2-sulfotransferase